MKRFRDIVPYPKIVLGVILFLGGLLGVHLLLPYVVNTQGVRQMLISRAAIFYHGEVDFSKLKPALLPWPHVRISQGRLTETDRIDLHIPDAAVYLKIIPLLSGKFRVDRIKLIKPSWLLDIGHTDASGSFDGRPHPTQSKKIETLSPFIGFLGSAEAKIVDGRLDLRRNGRPMVTISEINSRITTSEGQLHLHLNGTTEVDDGITLDADIDLHSLNSHGHLDVVGLQSRFLHVIGLGGHSDGLIKTAVDLAIEFHTAGLEQIQAAFEAKTPEIHLQNGERRATLDNISISGHAGWTPQNVDITLSHFRTAAPAMNWSGFFAWTNAPTLARPSIQISLNGADLEISPIRDFMLNFWGDQPEVAQVLDIVREGQIPSVTLQVSAPDWQVLTEMQTLKVDGVLTGGRIVVPDDLFDLAQVSGRVMIADGRLTASGLSARQGNASASNGALVMGLYDGSKAFSLDTLIYTEISEIPMAVRRLTSSQAVHTRLDLLPDMSGQASGRLTIGEQIDRLTVGIVAKARVKTGESDLEFVGSIEDLNGDQPSASGIVNGRMGSKVMDWVANVTEVLPKATFKTPFTMSGVEIDMASSGQMRLNGIVQWEDGARIGAALTVAENEVHLQQLRIRDAASDAQISFRNHRSGRLVDAYFAGYLDPSSLDRLVENHWLGSGVVQGRFRLHFDRDQPGRSVLDGDLVARDLEVQPGNGEAIHIIEASISGRGQRVDLGRTRMKWGEGLISLVGGGVLASGIIDVHGTVQADTFHTQKVLALLDRDAPSSSAEETPKVEPALSVRGRVRVEIDQLIHNRYRFAPMHARVEFKERETLIDVTEARLCGIQMPGQIRLSDGMAHLAFSPKAKTLSLQDAGSCLVDSQTSEKLMGVLDLDGAFTAKGSDREELLNNMKGEVSFSIEKGRISNVGSAGVFTNLLSYLTVNQYVKGDLPDLRKDDFAYNRIESNWAFGDGILRIEDGVLKSDPVNMVANGRYDLLSREVDLVVLVSPLTNVDWIIERIPILGNILQGTLVAIPVRVKGPGADPKVVPLSPKAVGSRLGGILKRTIKTPVRIIEPLLKDEGEQRPEADEN